MTTTHLIDGNWQLRNCFWQCKEVTRDHWCPWAPAQPLGWPSVIQGTFPAAWKYACHRDMKAKSLCQVYQFHNVKSLHPSLLDPRLDNTSNSKTASDYARVHFVCSCIKMSRSLRSYQNYRISNIIRKETGKVAAVLWVELATSPPGVMGKDKQKENGNEWTSNLLPLQKHLWPCSTMFPIALPAISKNIFIYQGLIMHGQCILSIAYAQPYF